MNLITAIQTPEGRAAAIDAVFAPRTCTACGKPETSHNVRHPFVAPARPFEARELVDALNGRLAELEPEDTVLQVQRCRVCGAHWRIFPAALSLVPGEECGPCCDNAEEMDLEPVGPPA